jgi:hypothetical protein
MLLTLIVVYKGTKNEHYTVDLYPEDTVSKIKEVLHDKSGYNPTQMILYFNSICLDNNQTIAHSSLKDSSVLELQLSSS